MEGMELIAFEIISNVGMAKSLAVEALRDARQGNFDEAEEKLEEASQYLCKWSSCTCIINTKRSSWR